ncbi:sensor histidine kinase, partial [Amycolatopsis sp. NPDC000673]
MKIERRWASVQDSLLPALLLLHVLTMWAPAELPMAATLTVALALPLVWRRRAPLIVFGVVATAAAVQ